MNGATPIVDFTYDAVGRLSTVTPNGTLTASYTCVTSGSRVPNVTSGRAATAAVDDEDRLTSL